ncbi:MAG: hypothetical protein AB7K24_33805 [Gemmataceae bacterium]
MDLSPYIPFLWLLQYLCVLSPVHLLGMAFTARAFGIGVTRLQFFFGPPLATFRFARMNVFNWRHAAAGRIPHHENTGQPGTH